MVMYAISVEHEHDLPAYVRVEEGSHCFTSVINPPPAHFQYSTTELPGAMATLKREYPAAFIAAHEVEHIDHEQMSNRWAEKRSRQLAAETTGAWLNRLGLHPKLAAPGKRK